MKLDKFQNNLHSLVDSISDKNKFQTLGKMVGELKSLLQHLETADKEAAEQMLEEFESSGDNKLFMEVGKLLRRFHDQLLLIREGIPEDLGKIANEEVIEMSERLQMIVTMTDKAANKTLDLGEELADIVTSQSASLEEITSNLDGILNNEKFPKSLTKSLKTTMKQVKDLSTQQEGMQSHLTEIMIAQDYQDLTGQVIYKVVTLLKSLETDLAQLVDKFGQVIVKTEDVEQVAMKGPLCEEDEAKKSQDDVDSLLTKFGF
jgi:chemotaxis protein CheZ